MSKTTPELDASVGWANLSIAAVVTDPFGAPTDERMSLDELNSGGDFQTVASGATVDLSTLTTINLNITGTANITSLGSSPNGTKRVAKANGAFTLINNTNIRVQGGKDAILEVGDFIHFFADGTNWDVFITRASGSSEVNLLTNSGFWFNDTGYVSGVALSSSEYGHDGYKAGSGGCTYTFTQDTIPTEINITAGTLMAHIEDFAFEDTSDYVLSWEGTSQARIVANSITGTFSGGFVSSPLIITTQTEGNGLSIEFDTGTLGRIVVNQGKKAAKFPNVDFSTEKGRSQRYVNILFSQIRGYQLINEYLDGGIPFPVPMRVVPSITLLSTLESENILSITRDSPDIRGCRLLAQATATGSVSLRERLLFAARLI